MSKYTIQQRRKQRIDQLRGKPLSNEPDMIRPRTAAEVQASQDPAWIYASNASNASNDSNDSNDSHESVSDPEQENQGLEDVRWNDPEYVWKQQNRQMWEHEDHHHRNSWIRSFFSRLLIAGVIYIFLFILFQVKTPWAKQTRDVVKSAYAHSYNYTRVALMYQRYFKDAPSWLPAFHNQNQKAAEVGGGVGLHFASPVKGTVLKPYPSDGGLVIGTSVNAQVHAMASGQVLFVGDRKDTGLTVVIEHMDRYETIYGDLTKAVVSKNDWVEQGSSIGIAGEESDQGTVYISVSRNGRSLDPAEVVNFD